MSIRSLCCFLAVAACAAASACTPAAKNVVQTSIDDTQKACVWANAAIPLPLVKEACGLVDLADDLVQAILDDFFAHQRTVLAYVARYEAAKAAGLPFKSLTAKPQPKQ